MSEVVKVIEVMAESNQSWEDAAAQAVGKAAKSVHNIKSIYIKNFEAKVEGDKITQYRVDAKLSFVLD
ncbi:MAG: dodecin domain-containing protein [Candidatus Eremiobacteraeota bacterium]|nr:dodecin domain-containing protein [Candidatus Eremiobacteraeota bacterium]MBC5826440.1 dodecin domain-containing protein [Candidatus Eremiobacteraeota bacterium]